MSEETQKHIDNLRSVDDETYYNMTYDDVNAFLQDDMQALSSYGSEATKELCSLLNNPDSWSSLFALEILEEIKDPCSIQPLISFIKNNPDYSDANEIAMTTLSSLGGDAIEPLLEEIREAFNNKQYHIYLVGSLIRIIDEKVYTFMKETIHDFNSHPQDYIDWFDIGHFSYYFEKQGNKEIIPLLEEILTIKKIRKRDRLEIQDTIKIMQDPKGYEEELKQQKKQFTEFGAVYQSLDEKKKIQENIPLDDISSIENTDMYTLINDKKEPVKIEEENRDYYVRLLYPIEQSIADFYKIDSTLKDRDVIFMLKHLRDNLFKKHFKPKSTLEKIILNNLKFALIRIGNDYSKFEVKACIKYVYNSVKRHKKVDGPQGYLQFISAMFDT